MAQGRTVLACSAFHPKSLDNLQYDHSHALRANIHTNTSLISSVPFSKSITDWQKSVIDVSLRVSISFLLVSSSIHTGIIYLIEPPPNFSLVNRTYLVLSRLNDATRCLRNSSPVNLSIVNRTCIRFSWNLVGSHQYFKSSNQPFSNRTLRLLVTYI